MKVVFQNKFSLLTVLLFVVLTLKAQRGDKFTIVLDAGHGGKDSGTSYHGNIEKRIALNTVLKIGNFLSKDKSIEVIYTRKTDVFVDLKDRANLANKKHADLFVSIHCNGVRQFGPFGTETYVMGLNRNATNLEVAKSENSVIFLENDYKKNYKGFDPNKPETLAGLKILQETYLDQSIELASKIQSNFTNQLKRKNRGVKQAPLWVLDASYMPSVLVEIGFISNKKEGKYLNSGKGQQQVARAIADAILKYKEAYFFETISNSNKPPVKNKSEVNQNRPLKNQVVYKIQLAATSRDIALNSKEFKKLDPIIKVKSNALYRYYYSEEMSYEMAQKRQKEAHKKGFETAFIVAFRNGKKIKLSEVIK